MTREDLYKAVMRSGLSREMSRKAVDIFFETICAALERGEKVNLKNFAAFETKSKAAIGHFDHRSGKRSILPAKRIIRVRFARHLRSRVNTVLGSVKDHT